MRIGQYLIITNNPKVAQQCKQQKFSDFRCCFVESDIREVAFQARDCLMNGYCLTADPLAGRRERPVPYLTVIMEKCEAENSNLAYEILRVEYFINVYCEHRHFLDSLSFEEKRDYGIIDESLTVNCFSLMLAGK